MLKKVLVSAVLFASMVLTLIMNLPATVQASGDVNGTLTVTAQGIPAIERLYVYDSRGAQVDYEYNYTGKSLSLPAGTYSIKGNNAYMTYAVSGITVNAGQDTAATIPTKKITATFTGTTSGYHELDTVNVNLQTIGGVQWGWGSPVKDSISYWVYDNNQIYKIKETINGVLTEFYIPVGQTEGLTKDELPLVVSSPTDNVQTTLPWVPISGKTQPGSKVTLNGYTVLVDGNGNFSSTYGIPLGTTKLNFVATDSSGNSTTVTITVRRPVITITSPSTNLQTNKNTVVVSGAAAPGASVKVNGSSVTLNGSNNYSKVISLNNGSNTITVTGTDNFGQTTTLTRIVVYDTTPPSLTINSPIDNLQTTQTWVALSGQVEVGAKLTVNGYKVVVDGNGNFSTTYNLQVGTTTLTFIATDAAGNTTTITKTVTRS